MSVEVEICGSAMIKLGSSPFNAFTDNTKEARLCNHQYAKIRDAALRTAPWNFAIQRYALTPITESPELEFKDGENVFQLPTEVVRVWKAVGVGVKFRQEGRYLISKETELRIKTVVNNKPVAFYDAEFKETVACLLAADLCYAITQSTSLKAELRNEAKFWIDQARSHNSQEGTPEDFQFDDFLGARFGGPDALY